MKENKNNSITTLKPIYNPALDILEKQSLFPEKVKKAKETLKKIGIPAFEFIVKEN